MEADELVMVYGTGNEIDLAFCAQVLAEAEIPAVEQKPMTQYYRHYPGYLEVYPYRLLVRAQDAEYARALVMDYLRKVEAGDYALPDNQDVEEQ